MNALQGISPGNLARFFERAVGARAARRAAAAPPRPAPPASEPLPVTKPVGESGASVRSVGRHNSFLRMFMVETSHLAAQLRRAGGLHRVIAQDVSLKVMVLPGGSPVAVAGSASTEHRAPDGRLATLRELAYVSFLRRFIAGSAVLVSGTGTQTAPPVLRNTDSLLSAVQVIRDRRLVGQTASNPLVGLLRSVSPRALDPMAGALGRIAEALADLELAFAGLARRETFTEVTAASSSPLFLEARARSGAPPGSHRVEVLQTARGQAVESDAVAAGPMGLAGTFKLNGTEVQVDAADALFDLVAKINRGEDLNGNGQLDAGEDANGNFRLDGGTAEHAVHASFFADRLELRGLDAAAGDIQVQDGDGVLGAIGLVERDEFGPLNFVNEVSAAREAVIRVEGGEFRSASGVFEDAIAGVTLEVRGQPDGPVTVDVRADTSGAVNQLRGAVEAFNSAIRTMNELLGTGGGLLARDPAATRVRAELVGAVLRPVAGQPEDLDEASEAGLARAERGRVGISEVQLAAAARGLRMGLPRPELARLQDPPSVYNVLDELGITAAGDDTLALDEERFGEVLAGRASEVADLFARAQEGIAVRVLGRLDSALGSSGLLALRQRAIESLAELGAGREFARALQQSQRARLLAGILPPAGG